MDNLQGSYSPLLLARRLQKRSARLNQLRDIREPAPSSRVPILGSLLVWLRLLLNRLVSRWFLVPILEQQRQFYEEVTAAFDELADVTVTHERQIVSLNHWQEAAVWRSSGETGDSPSASTDVEALFSSPPEALRAWEQGDLPADLDTRKEGLLAERADEESAISHPLFWKEQIQGWRYLFNLAVLGPALQCRPGDLVLDFAGGSGWVSEFLNRFGIHTLLLDYAEAYLRQARVRFAVDGRLQQYARMHPLAGDGMHLPIADETLDGVICMNALHHMPSYEAVLREIARVLKPGCRAVFGEPGGIHASSHISQMMMREHGVYEKNVPLDLIYVYATRAGFSKMWRYPLVYPDKVEMPFPKVGRALSTILTQFRAILPEEVLALSLFALQKPGERALDSDASLWLLEQHRLEGQITLLRWSEQVAAGSTFADRVRVSNSGDVLWLSAPRPLGGYVYLGARLYDEHRRLVGEMSGHASLSRDLAPGDEVELEIVLEAPLAPGRYILKYDLVDAWRTWFEMWGSRPAERLLVVTPGDG